MNIAVVDKNGAKTNTLSFDTGSLHMPKSQDSVVYFYVNAILSNQRQGTVSTKTRGDVSGGGKKPWRQKGTGRARVGSIRSPLWRHGGVIFGPQPREYRKKVNAQVKRIALNIAVKAAAEKGNIVVVEELNIPDHKTKSLLSLLKKFGVEKEKTIIVVNAISNDIYLAARNMPNVLVRLVNDINAYDVLNAQRLVFEKDAWEAFANRLVYKQKKD